MTELEKLAKEIIQIAKSSPTEEIDIAKFILSRESKLKADYAQLLKDARELANKISVDCGCGSCKACEDFLAKYPDVSSKEDGK